VAGTCCVEPRPSIRRLSYGRIAGRLDTADVGCLLDFVYELGADEQLRSSPHVVLDQLVELIPCANAVLFDYEEGPVAVAGDLRFPPAVAEAAAAFALQRPTAAERLAPQDGAVRLSERIGRRELASLGFYQEAMRPVGIEDELMVLLPMEPPRIAGFSFLRERPFTERERTMLELLAPHLARAASRTALPSLTEREREILSWVARGKTNKEIAALLFVTHSTVRKHLENVFEKLGVHTRTAAVARAFRSDTS
jgi:DNA-binding CsgD family transcriptional regulator